MAAPADKATWRRRMRAAWRDLSPAELGAISAAICRHIRTLLDGADPGEAAGLTAGPGGGGPTPRGGGGDAGERAPRREASAAGSTLAHRRAEPQAGPGGALEARPWALPRGIRGLMLYAPMPTEVDVSPLLDWARLRGIAVLLPWIDPRRGRMEARCVRSWDEVVPAPGQIGPWRLRQPADACPVWEPGTDTVIVVPGLAFDRHGWRLGRGGGYYDRFLAQWPAAWRVAVAPARMVVERLPRDPHDRRMDLIVTEGGVQGPWWGIR